MSFLNDRAFIGAIIGAIASLLGGFFASKYQLKKMEKAEDLKQKQRIKVSSQIVYGDIIILVKSMMYYRGNSTFNGFYFHYSADFSNHIDLLTGRIGGDKAYLLRRVYSHLVHMQDASVPPISKEKDNQVELVWVASCKLLYRSTENFISNTGHLWESLTEENYDHLKNGMEHNVKELIEELEKLKSEHL